jgi:peroxiredoxin
MDHDNQSNVHWVDDRLARLDPEIQWQPDAAEAWSRFKAQHYEPQSHGLRWLLVAAVVTAGAFSLTTFRAPRVFAHYCFDCSIALWQSLAPSRHGGLSVKFIQDRSPAPAFALEDSAGKTVKLSDFRGQVVLLNFWATWCGGCQTEIPSLVQLESKYKADGFNVLGVSMDDDGWKAVTPYLKAKKVNYPVVIGNDSLTQQYAVAAMPVTVLIDRKGRIADQHSGVINTDEYQPLIESLLKETR